MRQVVVRRTGKKRIITLDNPVMITKEETLLHARKYRVSELIGEGIAISSTTINISKEDEREAKYIRVELVDLRHQVEYYQDATQVVRLMKIEFTKKCSQFKSDREVFMTNIVVFQE
jgi:hypothetical protein